MIPKTYQLTFWYNKHTEKTKRTKARATIDKTYELAFLNNQLT